MLKSDRSSMRLRQTIHRVSLLVLALLLIWFCFERPLTRLLLLPVIIMGFYYRSSLSSKQRFALWGVMLLLAGYCTYDILKNSIIQQLAAFYEWDYLGFWLYGKVAQLGFNFYQPEYAHQVIQPLQPSSEFIRELVDTGFWYPPPSIFFFLPLGWFEPHAGFVFWYAIHTLILVGAIVLLWQLFVRSDSQSETPWLGLLFTATLVLASDGVRSNYWFAQTNFVALLFLLLYYRDRSKSLGGVWLALGILAKPYLAALLLDVLLRKRWRSLGSMIITGIVSSIITIAVFGFSTFFSYFRPGHYATIPDSVYTVWVNHSLLAHILRLTNYDFSNTSPTHHPVFLVSSFLLTAITVWVLLRLPSEYDDLAPALPLTLALLLYPSSLPHYTTLLILPILILWKQQSLKIDIWWLVAFVTLIYALLRYQNGLLIFFANFLSWSVLVVIMLLVSSRNFQSQRTLEA